MKIGIVLALAFVLPASAQTVADNNKPTASSTDPAAVAPADPLASAQALLKKGQYQEAAAAFRVIVDKDPSSAKAQAGLVRSLLRARKFDEAEDAGKKAVVAVPNSALVHAVMGDVNFRLGKLSEVEPEYRTALRLDANSARGWFGMARLYEMVSMFKKAQDAYATAHNLDPEDAQIFAGWLDSLPRAKRLEALKKKTGANPSKDDADQIKYFTALTEKKPWELTNEIKATEIKMIPYGRQEAGVYDINRNGPMAISEGYGLQVKFNDKASSVLLLDTGASGITIGRKLAERAGIVKIVDSYIGGVGDQGTVESYLGWADKVNIGGIEFHNCVVDVSSKNDVSDDAGLIGPDVFDKFLITLDFRNWKMALSPLPKNPAVTAGDDDEVAQDRYIAPEMQSYTKFFHFGHDLVVPVVVNDKAVGNFILDTGAGINSISPEFAAKVTKASYQGDYQVKGVSGRVERVMTGDKVILMFAKMRIESHDLPVFSTDNVSAWDGTEIAGFIGIRTLVQTKMTIDYRDGLVNLEVYEFKKARE